MSVAINLKTINLLASYSPALYFRYNK